MLQQFGGTLPATYGQATAAGTDDFSASILAMLWRRKFTVVATAVLCVLIAAAYLWRATPIYRATARVRVDETAPKVLHEGTGAVVRSETFVNTQAAALESQEVIRDALDRADYHNLKTFEGVTGDPVTWLLRQGALSIEVARRTDVIEVAMQSPYPGEAALLSNAVVEAYLAQQTERQRATGQQMIDALRHEKDDLVKLRDENTRRMVALKTQQQTLSFSDDKGNTGVERMAELSSSLTTAEVAAMELRARHQAVKAAMGSPAALSSFVQSLQLSSRDGGNSEYSELMRRRAQYEADLSTAAAASAADSPAIKKIQEAIGSLSKRIAEKETEIAAGYMLSISAELSAAESKLAALQKVASAQHDTTMARNPVAAEYSKLSAEAERMERQCDLLDNRIAQIAVNSIETKPTSLDFMERAIPEMRPVKPNKAMTLMAALMLGCVVGAGIALYREMRDQRMRTPNELSPLLGVKLMAMVPSMNPRLSLAERGQLVVLDPRSPAAEAYRDIRTTLQLGSNTKSRTILVASPASGDGKSTLASNLAIAFAQSGERTLLIDCDLRQPVQHQIFHVSFAIGVSSILRGRDGMRDAIRDTRVPDLSVLPAGPTPDNPSELLGSARFARMLQALSKLYDRIIIDSPPVVGVTDARVVASSVDATLLVLRMNRSQRGLGLAALESLREVGANVAGVVANDVGDSPLVYARYEAPVSPPRATKHLELHTGAVLTNGHRANGDAEARLAALKHAVDVPHEWPVAPREPLANGHADGHGPA